jgi:flagellar basal-body rod protein FlgB
MDKVFFEDSSMKLMERSLDLAVQRQGLISANVVNVDTPGYKTIDMNFEEELKRAVDPGAGLAVTNSRHFSSKNGNGTAAVTPVEGLTERNDLNNVNIDREMAQQSTNAMKFSMAAQLLAGKFRTLRSAINEGR